jgi:hypothetical protein
MFLFAVGGIGGRQFTPSNPAASIGLSVYTKTVPNNWSPAVARQIALSYSCEWPNVLA